MTKDKPLATLPFSVLKAPPFMPDRLGRWELRAQKLTLPKVRGYFRGLQDPPNPNWVLKYDNTVWMSVTPLELESQAHHAYFARGDVLVLGLGMGVLLYNLLPKLELGRVSSITVVEQDPDIIELVRRQAAGRGWVGMDRVSIQVGNVLEDYNVGKPFDIVLADIWPVVGDERLRPDLQTIARNFPAKQYAAWGLELDFMTWLSAEGIPANTVTQRHWRAYSRAIGVPLAGQEVSWMVSMARRSWRYAAEELLYPTVGRVL